MHGALLKGILEETGLRLGLYYEGGHRKATTGPLAPVADLVDLVCADGAAPTTAQLHAAGLATVLVEQVALDGVTLGTLIVGDTDTVPVHPAWRPILAQLAETLAAAALYHRTRVLFDQAGDMISWHSQEGRVTAVSAGVVDVLGYRPDELVGRASDVILDEVTLRAARSGGGGVRVISTESRRKDGAPVWLETTCRGGPSEVVAVTRDIAARKRADAMLAAEKRFLELVARGGRLDTILDALCRFYEEQTPGSWCSILLARGDRLYTVAGPSLPAGLLEALEAGIPIAPGSGSCGAAAFRGERVIVPDALAHPLFEGAGELVRDYGVRGAWSTPIKAAGGEILGTFAVYYREVREPEAHELELTDRLVHISDIAVERQRVADALRESEQRYRSVVDTLNEVIFQTDTAGRLTFLSASFVTVTGQALGDSLGRELASFVHPDDRARYVEGTRALLAGAPAGCNLELRVLRRDGSHRWIDLNARPTADAAGAIAGISGMFTDVTERKQLEAQLLVSDRMASMGTLVAGVAHEINNPLASVMLNIDYITRELGLLATRSGAVAGTDRLLESLRAASEGAERVRDIVRNLKIFSRGDERKRPVDVHHVLDSTIRMAQNEMRHRARLTREYGEVPLVIANEASLGQVFLNLLINAAHAIPEGSFDTNEIRVTTSTDREGRAVIEVRDTGVGIAPDVMSRIFDPFFTTKPIGLGTGLGLSICHRLVTGLGGEITVESVVGTGSRFRVTVPGAPRARQHTRAGAAPVPAVRSASILVVDDEPIIGEAVRRMLSPHHSVTMLTSGDEALRLIVAGERFDVILCDVMMPEMSGMRLHEELARLSPELARRMIFITGGAFTPWARTFLERVPNPIVEKPFDLKVLAATIRDALR